MRPISISPAYPVLTRAWGKHGLAEVLAGRARANKGPQVVRTVQAVRKLAPVGIF
jgi:hypothetical protein